MSKLLVSIAAAFVVAVLAVPFAGAESFVIPADAYLGSDQIVLTPDPYADPLAIDPPMNAQCNGVLVPGTYHDVTIPEHAFCWLFPGVHVTNDVRGRADSSLLVNSGVIVDHDVVMQNARSLQFGGGTQVGHDFRVNGLAGVPAPSSPYPNYLCNTFIGHDLGVTQLAAASNLTIGGSTGAFSCASIEVAHDVGLSNNAGFLDVSITGGGITPSTYQPCVDALGQAHVGHDLTASGNTAPGPHFIVGTNICHNLTVTNNSGANFVTANHAGDDANCSNNNPIVGGNTAEDQNNGC